MKIVLASGIYYPEIGGPALLVKDLADEFIKTQDVLILTYSNEYEVVTKQNGNLSVKRIIRHNKISNMFRYFLLSLTDIKKDDKVFVFDIFSAALPVYLASFIRRYKYTVRLGGDFLWEMSVNKFDKKQNILDFYNSKFNLIEKIYFFFIKRILKRADKIISTTDFQKDLVIEYYKIKESKFIDITNPFPELDYKCVQQKENKIIFAGRFSKLKNLDSLIKVMPYFKDYKLYLIGEGPEKDNLSNLIKELNLEEQVKISKPLFKEDLYNEICKAKLTVLPSYTDITPNTILLAIKLNTPVLMTKYSGFYKMFKNNLLFLEDPSNLNELKDKISLILNNNSEYLDKLSKTNTSFTRTEMINKYLDLI